MIALIDETANHMANKVNTKTVWLIQNHDWAKTTHDWAKTTQDKDSWLR